jgi:hypothetical protein
MYSDVVTASNFVQLSARGRDRGHFEAPIPGVRNLTSKENSQGERNRTDVKELWFQINALLQQSADKPLIEVLSDGPEHRADEEQDAVVFVARDTGDVPRRAFEALCIMPGSKAPVARITLGSHYQIPHFERLNTASTNVKSPHLFNV